MDVELLHASTIQRGNEIERDISSLLERNQNETLNEIYNETKLIWLLLTGKGATMCACQVLPMSMASFSSLNTPEFL